MNSLLKSSFMKHPLIWIASVLLLAPLFTVALTILITTQHFVDTWLWFSAHFEPFLLEYLVLLFACALLYAAFGRLWVSVLVPGLPLFAVTLVSYYKTIINGTPLLLSDLSLTAQFSEVARFAFPQITLSFCTAVALLLFFLLCLLLYFADKHLIRPRRLRIIAAASAGVFAILFLCTPLFTLWASSLDREPLSQDERAREYGAALGLYTAYAHDKHRASGLMDAELLLEQLESLEPEEPEPSPQSSASPQPSPEPELPAEPPPQPTVIFLMSESFFDVTRLPGVAFSEDPLPVFHALAEEHSSGRFISSTYCGGTAWVEMEVLTGICANYLNEADTLTSLPEDRYAGMPTITDIFKAQGYSATFLHSYTPALYNREMIYSRFGFDQILFSDSFDEDAEMRGGYLSDMALSEKIISLYESDPEQPALMYAVSMENHQPYTAGKYPDGPSISIESELLTAEEQAVLEAYTTGVKDADRALGRLVDYFSQREEPVMIVFFGDHLPNLGLSDGETIYSRLGYSSTSVTTDWQPEELTQMLSTDYLIWTNYEDTPLPDKDESCTVLGLSVLNRLGFELTDFYAWLNRHVVDKMLLYRPRLFVDAKGCAYGDIPEAYKITMNGYGAAIYNIVYGDQGIFPVKRREAG